MVAGNISVLLPSYASTEFVSSFFFFLFSFLLVCLLAFLFATVTDENDMILYCDVPDYFPVIESSYL
jgi:hypothetical protein